MKVLLPTLIGDVDRKIKAMNTIIYAMENEEQKKQGNRTTKWNRRMKKIAQLRKEQRNSTKCFKKADMYEQKTLKEQRNVNRERTRTLRSADNFRKNRRERVRKRSQFTDNPFKHNTLR